MEYTPGSHDRTAQSKEEDEPSINTPTTTGSIEEEKESEESIDEKSPHPQSQAQPVQTGNADLFRTTFADNDSKNPRNFSPAYKAWITMQLGLVALVANLASSVIAPAEPALSREFDISSETSVLIVSLYVLGFAFGPICWGPISEVYGRKMSMIPAVAALGLFSIGSAVSRNPQSLFITRFLGGVFGSAPISNVSATLSDIYEPRTRGIAITFYGLVVMGGPSLGAVIGSALTSNKSLGWRWTQYIIAILAFTMVILSSFALPESFSPVLLKREAARLRQETGDTRRWHPQELERIRLNNVFTKYFNRPLRMFITEPVVTCMTLYTSFVYGLFFMMLEVFPIVYREQRHLGLVVSTLPLLALLVGVICAMCCNLIHQTNYQKQAARKGGLTPEARLPPVMVGGICLTIGLFWFGWTAEPKYHWAVPTVAAVFIGAGFITVFQQTINYIVDVYGPYSTSAMAANTSVRSLFAFGLPLVAGPMFKNLGVAPAASLLGGLSCLGLPMPFIFMKFGPRLRGRSEFAPPPTD